MIKKAIEKFVGSINGVCVGYYCEYINVLHNLLSSISSRFFQMCTACNFMSLDRAKAIGTVISFYVLLRFLI